MQNFPLVSVIVLNYNGLRYLKDILKQCLDSVLRTDYPNLEIIFVDNGSADGSPDFVRRNYNPEIRVINNERNLGFAEGFNRGIKASRGRYVALLSNDMIVDPSWLKPLVTLMEEDPKIGVTSCKRIVYGTRNIIDGIGGNLYLSGRARSIGKYEIDRGQYNVVRDDLDYLGGIMVLRRKIVQKAGLFDPDYIVFSEDVDLCYRIRKLGYRIVYVPDAIVWHRGKATFSRIDRTGRYVEYMSSRSRIRFIIIHFVLIRLLSAFLIDLVWIFLASPTTKKLLLKAYWWNLKNIGTTLRRRLRYGSSPPFVCKFPVISFSISTKVKRPSARGHKRVEKHSGTHRESQATKETNELVEKLVSKTGLPRVSILRKIELSDPWNRMALSMISHSNRKGVFLEVGCGLGGLCIKCSHDNELVVGIDLSRRAILSAQLLNKFSKSDKSKEKVHFLVADAEHLPLRPHIFTMVACIETLEHISDSMQALSEIVRVNKTNGHVLLIIPNILSGSCPEYALMLWRGQPRRVKNVYRVEREAIFHYRKIKRMLTNAGLRLVRVEGTCFPHLPFVNRWLRENKGAIGNFLIWFEQHNIPALSAHIGVLAENKNG